MAQDKKRYDVAVIGAGITGLSAALHLEARGVARVALSSSTKPRGATRLATGLGTAGFIDNFTRFSYQFGTVTAAESWHFAQNALHSLVSGANRLGISVRTGRHYRLATGEDELVEARRAIAELRGEGFAATLAEGACTIGGLTLTPRVLAVQEDETKETVGAHALAIDCVALMEAMTRAVKARRVPETKRIRYEPAGLVLEHADGVETRCEVVICAAHLDIAKLVPGIASALVSVADQWCRVVFKEGTGFPDGLIGSVFSAKHGHEWGGFLAPGEMILGGARYLRKWAGIEATEAEVLPAISQHLLKLAVQTFALNGRPELAQAESFLDCRPCDELPVIGPMFGDGRVLVATGFLGAGLTVGWLAGECLAELVATGKSARLPRRYWPERLRSLEG